MKTLIAFVHWLRTPSHIMVGCASLLPLVFVLLYVYSYRVAVPFRDEWQLDARAAIAATEGRLTLKDLVFVNDGHRTFFTNLSNAIFAVTSHWDLRQEALIIPLLACLCFCLLLLILHRAEPGSMSLLPAPLSLLTFALFRSHNWWSVRHSQWYFVNFFFLACVWVACRKNLTLRYLILACLLGWCATFSLATGMLVWPIALVLFWLNGERRVRFYSLWIIAGSVAIALYLINSGIFASLGSGDSYVSTDTMLQPSISSQSLLEFIPRFLGAGILLDFSQSTIAARIGWFGLLLFALQVIYFWRLRLGMTRLLPWLGIAAFALGSAFITALGRSDSLGVNRAFTLQYTAASDLFWIALVALMVISVWATFGAVKSNRLITLMNGISVVTLFGMFMLYGYSSLKATQDDAIHWEHSLTLSSRSKLLPDEQCAIDFLYTQRTDCLGRIMGSINRQIPALHRIAADNLAIFAQVPSISILPNGYRPQSLVVIASPNIWINVHVRDRLLDSVAEEDIYHLVSDAAQLDEARQIPHPPLKVMTGTDQQASSPFKQQITQVDQVWIAEMASSPNLAADYVQTLKSQGYTSVYSRRLEQPAQLTLTGYQRLTQPPQAMLHVGNDFVMQGWILEHDVNAKVCDSVTVETLWSSETTPKLDYSMTAVIAGSDGLGVARTDGAPAGLETSYWQPNQLYADRRAIKIPCDLAKGDYSLLIGLYDYGTGQNLPATSMDGADLGGLVYLTTLHIQ